MLGGMSVWKNQEKTTVMKGYINSNNFKINETNDNAISWFKLEQRILTGQQIL